MPKKLSWHRRVRALQDKLGLDDKAFAEQLGVALSTLHSWKYRPDRPISQMGKRRIEALEKQQQ